MSMISDLARQFLQESDTVGEAVQKLKDAANADVAIYKELTEKYLNNTCSEAIQRAINAQRVATNRNIITSAQTNTIPTQSNTNVLPMPSPRRPSVYVGDDLILDWPCGDKKLGDMTYVDIELYLARQYRKSKTALANIQWIDKIKTNLPDKVTTVRQAFTPETLTAFKLSSTEVTQQTIDRINSTDVDDQKDAV